jgi:hypothetical protein
MGGDNSVEKNVKSKLEVKLSFNKLYVGSAVLGTVELILETESPPA